MKKTFLQLFYLTFFGALIVGCSKKSVYDPKPEPVSGNASLKVSTGFPENFETGSKTAYAAANVTLSTGIWNLNDALLGTSTSDVKNGTECVRVHNTGSLSMQFDATGGAGTVTVLHALYGTDASSQWGLWMSTNGGTSWTQVGSTVTTSSTTLQTASFAVNKAGNIRFQILKSSGGTNRINFDDFSFDDYGSGTTGGSATRDDNMALGNPSGAVANTNSPTNYLMTKTQYTHSYNSVKGTSNWVSWHLSTAWLGSTARQDNFRSDTDIPSQWYHVTTNDYTGTGFDRGHMCPSGDRTGSVADNSTTFLMSNMVPQAPNNNEVTWESLENYCRNLTSLGNELYIISGPYSSGGSGSNGGTTTTIASGKVTVPASTWKVIVVLPVGTSDVSRINSSTRVIAVNMINTQAVNAHDWGYYRVSVDHLESLTGYDFLSNVPVAVQNVIEASIDNGPTQ